CLDCGRCRDHSFLAVTGSSIPLRIEPTDDVVLERRGEVDVKRAVVHQPIIRKREDVDGRASGNLIGQSLTVAHICGLAWGRSTIAGQTRAQRLSCLSDIPDRSIHDEGVEDVSRACMTSELEGKLPVTQQPVTNRLKADREKAIHQPMLVGALATRERAPRTMW